MSNELPVHRDRTTIVSVDLGYDVTGETITSEIRSEPKTDAPLIATWFVEVLDAPTGQLQLTMSVTEASQIKAAGGFMDIKRDLGNGVILPGFDKPLEVSFTGAVTQ